MTIVTVAVIGVAGVFLALIFKQQKEEYTVLITIAISLLLCFFLVRYLQVLLGQCRALFQEISGLKHYGEILFKTIGIAYIAEFSSDISRDAGFQTIAAQIELFAKLAILLLTLPILTTLIQIIQAFLS